MKRTTLAIIVTLLTMASTTFAATQASPGTSVAPTMQISATVQTAIRLTLAASTGCAFSAPTGGQDFAMNFGTVDALAINAGACVGAGAGKYAPTSPGVSDDTIYYSNYSLTPEFTSQAQANGTISAYVSTNFAHQLGVSPRARERPGNRYLPQVPGTGGAARGAGESGQPGEPAFRGTWATGRTGSPENLGNRANRNSEAGRPVDLDR